MAEYHPVPNDTHGIEQEETSVTLLSDPDFEDHAQQEKFTKNIVRWNGKQRRVLQYLPWILHFLLISFELSIFGAVWMGIGIKWESDDKADGPAWPSINPIASIYVSILMFSDIYDDLHLTTGRLEYDGVNSPSDFMGRPSNISDGAWDKLLSVGMVSISPEEHARMVHSSAKDIRNPGKYMTELNVFHELHCLSMLREQIWRPVDLNWQNDGPLSWWEFHLDHCLEHIRVGLMCSGDITPQTFEWSEEHYAYSLSHMQTFECKNFDHVWDWASKRNTTGDSPNWTKGIQRQGFEISDQEKIWMEDHLKGDQHGKPSDSNHEN
ncbi:hypothetical protein NA57DRAFT_59418 [Rhizodiscina lignyota]|uniref:Uncharacterized protein n=1 Tax=Rhizodiscina lignyota TaxID=1504668 RepID=A0A9P4I5K4_9PEZI|nr:hypothetical protein NA57DRAFT_59418 [Rhizodiscina lignyota]